MANLLLKYLHSQVSLDVCERERSTTATTTTSEFEEVHPRTKPLDYQQQINLYKKYTELKKSPYITQSQEFNRRISSVIEKTGASRPKSTVELNTASLTEQQQQQQQQQPSDPTTTTRSAVETTSRASRKMTSDGKKSAKSKSTTQIDKQSSMNSSSFQNHQNSSNTDVKARINPSSYDKNRAVSQSPQRSGGQHNQNHDALVLDGPSSSASEGKRSARADEAGKKTKPNGFIKRLSMRFKSLSIENNADQQQQDQHGKKTTTTSARDKAKQKSKEEIYSEHHSSHMSQEKAMRNIMRQDSKTATTTTQPSAPQINNYYNPVNYNVTKNRQNQHRDSQDSNELDIDSKFSCTLFNFFLVPFYFKITLSIKIIYYVTQK